ncbi:hypothetical protein BJ165DRAFT_1399942 [Panaeolus papilionaceus]|nr:hypothetical protein BJ165DRAFT_1399942 [Panaeolus papilionaceus]
MEGNDKGVVGVEAHLGRPVRDPGKKREVNHGTTPTKAQGKDYPRLMKLTEVSSHKAKQRSEAPRNAKSVPVMAYSSRDALHPSEAKSDGERMPERDNKKRGIPHPQGQSGGEGNEGEYRREQEKNP